MLHSIQTLLFIILACAWTAQAMNMTRMFRGKTTRRQSLNTIPQPSSKIIYFRYGNHAADLHWKRSSGEHTRTNIIEYSREANDPFFEEFFSEFEKRFRPKLLLGPVSHVDLSELDLGTLGNLYPEEQEKIKTKIQASRVESVLAMNIKIDSYECAEALCNSFSEHVRVLTDNIYLIAALRNEAVATIETRRSRINRVNQAVSTEILDIDYERLVCVRDIMESLSSIDLARINVVSTSEKTHFESSNQAGELLRKLPQIDLSILSNSFSLQYAAAERQHSRAKGGKSPLSAIASMISIPASGTPWQNERYVIPYASLLVFENWTESVLDEGGNRLVQSWDHLAGVEYRQMLKSRGLLIMLVGPPSDDQNTDTGLPIVSPNWSLCVEQRGLRNHFKLFEHLPKTGPSDQYAAVGECIPASKNGIYEIYCSIH